MEYKTSKVFQKGKSKQLQARSEQLQKENNEMEQRIVALKQMMQKEREERERLGGTRWKSSRLPQDTQQINSNSDKKPAKPKGQPKFKILSDKPVDKYKTKTQTENENGNNNSSLCGQCESSKAKLECVECGEVYCPPCFKQFHSKGAMRKHDWQPIDQGRPLSTKSKAQNIEAHRPRPPAPKTRDSSVEETVSLDTPLENDESSAKSGGLLFEGTYNEEESAASFQEALREWRNSSPKNGLWVNPANEEKHIGSKSCETETDSSGLPTVSNGFSDIKLTFKSSLTYADRLMLKKHRKDPEAAAYTRPNNKHDANLQAKSSNSKATKASPKTSRRSPRLGSYKLRNSNNQTKKQNHSHRNDADFPKALQIQLLPSDEDDSKYCSSDQERSSPIVSYTADEQPTPRTDRFTLSQLGRLAIVELSFSDPENDCKSKESITPVGPKSHSSLSLKRAASGMRNQYSEKRNTTPPHAAHPPNMPSNTYVARQKILMEKNKKGINGESSSSKVKKILKQEDRKWRPTDKYVGLNSFFMAGVEKENIESAAPHGQNSGSGKKESPMVMDTNSFPTISVGLADCWRPESSLSQVEEPSINKRGLASFESGSRSQHKNGSTRNNTRPLVKNIRPSPIVSPKKSSEKPKLVSPKIVKSELSTNDENGTPRVSMTDFDFLSAMPPMSKGDDLHKLHRASTVTLFALSPQPPDVWNDDSEIELPTANVTAKRDAVEKGAKSKTKDIAEKSESAGIQEQEDNLALEALSKEIEKDNLAYDKEHGQHAGHSWEEDSLSIEDNDDGSGLTSSGDGDTYYDGDDSDDLDLKENKAHIAI